MPHVIELPNVQDIRLSVCEASDFREAAEHVQAAALRIPGVDAVGIYAFDCNRDFHLVSYAGVTASYADLFRQFSSNTPQARLVMRGEPIYARVSDLPPERSILYIQEGLKAIAVYPIKHRKSVVGSLHIGTRQLEEIPTDFCAQLEVFVQSLANSIARIAYEAMAHKAYNDLEAEVEHRTSELRSANDALRKSESRFREHAWRLEVLSEITGRLLSTGSTPEMLEAVFASIAQRLGLDVYMHFRPSPDQCSLLLRAYGGLTAEQIAPVRQLALGEEVCGTVALHRKIMYLSHVESSREANTALLQQLNLKAYVCHPLLAHDRLVGTLSFGSRAVSEFDRGTLALLRTIADQIAIAIARHDAEAAVTESEARFRQLADAMPQLVWTAQSDGTIDYCNRHAEDYTGLTCNANGSWDAYAAIHPEDLKNTIEAWARAVSSGEAYQIEYRLRLRSGEYRWHLTRARPYRDEYNRLIKWYATSTDIEDLRRGQQALEEAQRRKDDFIAMLGHELRNPLAPIRNVVHVLKRGQSTDQRLQRSYDMIERQVSHMARLIDDLLDVSRISHGKIQLKKCKVDVADILKTCAEDFHPLMERSSLLFHQQIPDEPVWVYGDTARLEQIVSNLLINAMKFTDPGGSVTLGLVVLGNQAEITVQDTGVGMGPEVLRRVFDPFCQANKSADRSRGGLGLGLALVKGLVELHGGQVKAESPGTGLGALLRVRLPLQMPVAAVQCEKPASLEKETKALRVLIIEDNIDAADSLQLLLSTFGHDVSLANSGSEGVEKASEFKPDVILCDIGLPGSMDGYAVARALRNDPQFTGLQMIAMTGYGQDEDRRRAKEAGFDRHLTKPVNPETLEHLLTL